MQRFKYISTDTKNPLVSWGHHDVIINGRKMLVQCPLFLGLDEKIGEQEKKKGHKQTAFLPRIPEAHALFSYSIKAAHALQQLNRMVYEHEPWPEEPDWSQLWLVTQRQYQADSNLMGKFWPVIDKQYEALDLALIPSVTRIRRYTFQGVVH